MNDLDLLGQQGRPDPLVQQDSPLPTVVDTTTDLIAKLRDPRRRDQVLRLGRLVDADLQELDLREVLDRVRSSPHGGTVADDAAPWRPRR